MKVCETCGKQIKWGEEYTRNGISQCQECALKQTKETIEKKDGSVQNTSSTVNNKTVKNPWSDTIKAFSYAVLVIGIIISIAIGGYLIAINGDDGGGIIAGIIVMAVGILSSIVSRAVLMTIATTADDVAAIKATLKDKEKDE